jgi:hypothetical protein
MLTGQQTLANPLGWQQSAMSGNSSVMNAPFQSPGLGRFDRRVSRRRDERSGNSFLGGEMGKLSGDSGFQGRQIEPWRLAEGVKFPTGAEIGAGKQGGQAYDQQNAPHAGPATNFDVSQAQLPPEYFQQQPYIQQAIQRFDPREPQQGAVNSNPFYGY